MKKNTEKKINFVLRILIIVILVPLLLTIVLQKMKMEDLLAEAGTVTKETRNEDELVGIVAKEISMTSTPEAIKAQCVIARTNLWASREQGGDELESLSAQEMQALWGKDYGNMLLQLQTYVNETKGEVLTWQGSYISAAFHAISGGMTRSMEEYVLDTPIPYLKSVECHGDMAAPGYLEVLYWSREDFLALCQKAFPEAGVETVEDILILSRDSADYVGEIQVGTEIHTGEEFRSAMELNSADFSIIVSEDAVRVITKGLGHGFGLSQYYANELAKQGKNYQEILEYFYPGAEITTL